MGFIGFLISIVGLVFAVVAFVPFLGWLNWLVIPFAITGLTLSSVGIVRCSGRLLGIPGAIICSVVIVLSTIRLIIGMGII